MATHTTTHSNANTAQEGLISSWSTSGYKYQQLDLVSRQIRLLHLDKNCDPLSTSTPLHFDVVTSSLPVRNEKFARLKRKYHDFYAVSYAWGDQPRASQIVLDGKTAIVPDSAEEALRGLLNAMHKAGIKRTSYIWIDAICINQQDVIEMSGQVAMMGDLYSAARSVLIWLGPDNAASAVGHKWDIMRKVDRQTDGLALEQVLNDILLCKWFSRLWVVQEAVLAKAAHIFCGQQYLTWKAFSKAVHRLREHSQGLTVDLIFEQDYYNPLLIASVICDLAISKSRPSSQLLGLNTELKGSRPHDRVFAILGLRDAKDSPIVANYERPLVDVYADAAYSTMADEKSLEILWHAAIGDSTFQDHPETPTAEWPSWVPRFDQLSAGRNTRTAAMLGREFRADAKTGCMVKRLPEAIGIRTNGVIVGQIGGTFELKEPARLKARPKPDVQDTHVAKCFADFWGPDVLEHLQLSKWSERHLLAIEKALPHFTIAPMSRRGAPLEDRSGKENICFLLRQAQEFALHENTELKQVLKDMRADRVTAHGFYDDLKYTIGHYALMRLDDGRFGICTLGATEGDYICVLFGQSAPVILRRQGQYWKIRGVAKIEGIMKGEYVQQLKDHGRLEEETKTFDII